MKRDALRPRPPCNTASTLIRPRPTAAAALLLASVLSLPFALLALIQAVL